MSRTAATMQSTLALLVTWHSAAPPALPSSNPPPTHTPPRHCNLWWKPTRWLKCWHRRRTRHVKISRPCTVGPGQLADSWRRRREGDVFWVRAVTILIIIVTINCSKRSFPSPCRQRLVYFHYNRWSGWKHVETSTAPPNNWGQMCEGRDWFLPFLRLKVITLIKIEVGVLMGEEMLHLINLNIKTLPSRSGHTNHSPWLEWTINCWLSTF